MGVLNMNAEFELLYSKAYQAGTLAALKHVPTPMNVIGGGNSYYVPDGMCGFAWVNVKPGNSKFARWLKEKGIARKDSYYGGVSIWIHEYNQSYEKKQSHAIAMARVLEENGIKANYGSRLD